MEYAPWYKYFTKLYGRQIRILEPSICGRGGRLLAYYGIRAVIIIIIIFIIVMSLLAYYGICTVACDV